MSHAIYHQSGPASAAKPAGERGLAAILRGTPRSWLRALAGAWRHAAARREFEQVDDSALRDLGISRGEFDSYWAETHGLAELTRRRVTRDGRDPGL